MATAEPIRLGVLGLGRAGYGMIAREVQGRERLFRAVAGCDLVPEKRKRFADAYGCATYERMEDLLADASVELVVVATRSSDHADHAARALKAGKAVLLEKPMSVTYAEAKRLVALAKRLKGRLFIRHNRRFEPPFMHIREIIASGILGEVVEVKLSRTSFARRDDWQTILEFGGGQLLNWGPHIVEHGLRLLEAPVASQWSALRRIAAVGDAEDHLKIVLVGTNGRIVDIEISGGAAIKTPEYVIWGTRGGLQCTGDQIALRYLDPKVRLAPRKAERGDPGPTFGTPEELPWMEETIQANPSSPTDIWQELYAAVREGKRFPISLEQALEVMKVITASRRGTPFQPKPRTRPKAKRRPRR